MVSEHESPWLHHPSLAERASLPAAQVQRLKMIITSLTKAMAKAMPVVTVGALLISIFSVLGVQLFAGRLNMCSNEAVLTRAQCVGDWVNADGLTARMQWKRAMGNGKTGGFDNYLQVRTQHRWDPYKLGLLGSSTGRQKTALERGTSLTLSLASYGCM